MQSDPAPGAHGLPGAGNGGIPVPGSEPRDQEFRDRTHLRVSRPRRLQPAEPSGLDRHSLIGISTTPGPGRVTKTSARPIAGNSARYASSHREANAGASSEGASAQTLPPNPAPNPLDAKAPQSRASRGERARLRRLVVEQLVGVRLRRGRQRANRGDVLAAERLGRLRDAAVLGDEVLQPRAQVGRAELAGSGGRQPLAQPIERVGRARQSRPPASATTPGPPRSPPRRARAGRERRAVVAILRAARLVGLHTARGDDKPPRRRHRIVAEVAHGHVRVGAHAVGDAGENRGVVLAAAVGADAARARERAERQPVLDGAEVSGEIEGGRDRLAATRAARRARRAG